MKKKIRPQFHPVSYMEGKCYMKAKRNKNRSQMKNVVSYKLEFTAHGILFKKSNIGLLYTETCFALENVFS